MIIKAAHFKDARKLLGWTQVRLAEKSGVNWTTISYIEGGVRPVPAQTVLGVQRALEAAGVQFVSGQPRVIWRPIVKAPRVRRRSAAAAQAQEQGQPSAPSSPTSIRPA